MAEAGPIPDFNVTAVFLDLENPSRALVYVALGEGPEGGLTTTDEPAFPFPIVLEEGKWRLDLFGLAGGRETEMGCPFAGASEAGEEFGGDQPRIVRTEEFLGPLPTLEPPPGVRVLDGGREIGIGKASASVLLRTDMPLAELLEFYRQRVLEPGWKVHQEEMSDELAVLTWTFQFDDGFDWIRVLLIAPAGEDLRWVRLWMGGGGTPRPVPDVPAG